MWRRQKGLDQAACSRAQPRLIRVRPCILPSSAQAGFPWPKVSQMPDVPYVLFERKLKQGYTSSRSSEPFIISDTATACCRHRHGIHHYYSCHGLQKPTRWIYLPPRGGEVTGQGCFGPGHVARSSEPLRPRHLLGCRSRPGHRKLESAGTSRFLIQGFSDLSSNLHVFCQGVLLDSSGASMTGGTREQGPPLQQPVQLATEGESEEDA